MVHRLSTHLDKLDAPAGLVIYHSLVFLLVILLLHHVPPTKFHGGNDYLNKMTLLRRLQVPHNHDELPPTYLINHDIKPIEKERRSWGK